MRGYARRACKEPTCRAIFILLQGENRGDDTSYARSDWENTFIFNCFASAAARGGGQNNREGNRAYSALIRAIAGGETAGSAATKERL